MSLQADIARMLRAGRATRERMGPGRTADAVRREYGRRIDALAASLERAHDRGAKDGIRDARLDRLGREIALPSGAEYAETRAVELLTSMAAEQRLVLARVSAYANRLRLSATQRLHLMRSAAGLNTRQAEALLRRHATMLEAGTSARVIRQTLTQQSDRWIAQRARMIAETEDAVAGNRGKEAAWRDGQALGLISRSARRVWRTHLDERTCPTCSALDGVSIPIDGAWDASGVAVASPGEVHPHCRCGEELIDVSLTKAA